MRPVEAVEACDHGSSETACRFLQTDWTGSHKPVPKNDKIDNPCFLACFRRFSHNYPKARNSQPPKLKGCQTPTPWVTHVDQVNHQFKRLYLMPTMLLFHWLSSKSMDLARIWEGLRVFYSRCSKQGRHKQPHLLSIKTNERLLSTTTITISKKGPATRGHRRVFCILVCPKTRMVVNMDAFWQKLSDHWGEIRPPKKSTCSVAFCELLPPQVIFHHFWCTSPNWQI